MIDSYNIRGRKNKRKRKQLKENWNVLSELKIFPQFTKPYSKKIFYGSLRKILNLTKNIYFILFNIFCFCQIYEIYRKFCITQICKICKILQILIFIAYFMQGYILAHILHMQQIKIVQARRRIMGNFSPHVQLTLNR